VDGRATEAALRALSEALGVRRSALSLVTGATSRTKVVEVEAPGLDAAVLEAEIERLRQNGATG
jgi:uncharacterized protein YggU (UPF0235/DUF167 family)